ncbi:murein biosynthesis integral membrane protein MurJ [Anabaena sp. UHCC 0451]|uniref:murein biosynthesis integral membrane protein MurJ n=1 Tax=Anabaena sp. UHCC 0451 TaxID=2055235 RepID=UPI002B220BAD|nr:murein biosynthesis integral membrane protein MurJ [Anabaena sp. UHCC 0451]MEA5579043.1 murein biosynthesis integral membrane protein MurJ [Anabaena sp. UHCC 0451]
MKIWRDLGHKVQPSQNLIDYWNKMTSGSINRQIFGAAVTVALFTVLVKLVAVVKELVVAHRFGTGDELDAFLIALLVPSFVINVIAGSFNAALIPTYIQVREQEGKQAAQRLFSGVTIWGLGLLVITTILMLVAAPLYLPVIANGFDRQKLDLTFHLLYAIAPFILLSGISIIWSAVLNAGERFALAAFSPIFTPGITIILLLGFESWRTFALAAGLICGTAMEIVILGIALKKQKISLLPKWYGFNPHLHQVTKQYVPMIAGSFLMCSTGLVDQSMAAMLPSGSVAALSYGSQVITLPISLATTALSTAVIPYFSKMVAHQDWTNIHHTLKHYLKIILIVTVPLTLLLIVFSEQIVQLLYQRGSFTVNDTQLVAKIQFYFAFQIPFYVANILVVRLISAMQLNYILMQVSGLNLIINIVLNYVFMQWMGIIGIALSTSCVYVFCFLYMFTNAKVRLKKV